MRNLTLSLVVVIGVISLAHAQTRVGMKVGPLLTTLHTSYKNLDSGAEPNNVASNKLGFSIGTFSQFVIKDKFIIRPEIGMHRKKIGLYNGFFNSAFFTTNLLVGYRPLKKYKRLSILVGPEVNTLLAGTLRQDQMIKKKNELQYIDIVMNLGLDYQWDNGLGVGLRYLHGVENYLVNLVPFPNARYKTRSIQFYFSYSFIK